MKERNNKIGRIKKIIIKNIWRIISGLLRFLETNTTIVPLKPEINTIKRLQIESAR